MKKISRKLTAILAAAMCMTMGLTACGSRTETASSAGSAASAAASQTTSAKSETATPTASSETEAVSAASQKENKVLLMATTTSTDNTGLLDYLQPIFLKDTGYDLQWTSVGTGDALQMGMDGEVSVVLVHAKAKEEQFVADGWGVSRVPVMYNDFVIVGPKDGPVAYGNDITAAFTQIFNDQLVFVSRGDNSGTDTKEKGIWEKISLPSYADNPNYLSAGAGMADTLAMTNEKQGYTLSDRGTWLSQKANYPDMDIICEKDDNLLNQYGVIAVNPDKYADTNIDGANAFIDWITSPEIQKLIGEFGVEEYGEPLFVPNADTAK